ncbi:hypothetical protein [Anaerospora hongkongensis]|uniref:hypothetical protein n=1 Tax=Anaerospora hongkongensis TaxID=244830 RepID=UPI00289A7632|nr:hypothetical protein [Anaerospora hongkongensis]
MARIIAYLNAHIDKVAHFGGGFFLCVNLAVWLALVINPLLANILAWLITGSIGRLKEQWDRDSGKGTPDKWDFWLTVIGSTWGAVLMFIK